MSKLMLYGYIIYPYIPAFDKVWVTIFFQNQYTLSNGYPKVYIIGKKYLVHNLGYIF